ncbi:hypothetical protein NDU88_005691 [Pleurodeles waltl]|uniref:Uncharacterized protein n=1 Tax=Pleurodeles waltl TaxID=8319 RepID=A0AAV7PNF1_PLEWA|nr:hypothetical protein NDU88_005691 [Pleurodeles waltl]
MSQYPLLQCGGDGAGWLKARNSNGALRGKRANNARQAQQQKNVKDASPSQARKHNCCGPPIATAICSDTLNCWVDPTRRSKIMGRTKVKQFEDVETPTPDGLAPVSSAKGHADKLDVILQEIKDS